MVPSAGVPTETTTQGDAGAAALERARRKAYGRIIPLVFICYAIAYIDRANVAFAKLTMAKDLGFDDEIFGTGFGIFFIGYVLLEIPGAILVERWSARKMMCRIMVMWGIVSALTSLPDHGFWALGKNRLYVHRGTGHYGFPLRVGVPAEQSLLSVHAMVVPLPRES